MLQEKKKSYYVASANFLCVNISIMVSFKLTYMKSSNDLVQAGYNVPHK